MRGAGAVRFTVADRFARAAPALMLGARHGGAAHRIARRDPRIARGGRIARGAEPEAGFAFRSLAARAACQRADPSQAVSALCVAPLAAAAARTGAALTRPAGEC